MPAARIALWGTFDVDNYGDHLFPRVAAHELGRRLPGATVAPFAPYGWLHPTPLDGGRVAAPLGPWSEARARQLAAAHPRTRANKRRSLARSSRRAPM